METAKKILLIIVIICLLGAGISGAFYFFKKNTTKEEKIPEPTITTMASTSPEAVIPGYKQDTSLKIPNLLPEGLVENDDILFVITSFSVVQNGNNQYTFKYQSKKNVTDLTRYFITYLTRSKWQMMSKPETSNTSAFMSAKKGDKEKLFITISNLSGVVVDITYIK